MDMWFFARLFMAMLFVSGPICFLVWSLFDFKPMRRNRRIVYITDPHPDRLWSEDHATFVDWTAPTAQRPL